MPSKFGYVDHIQETKTGSRANTEYGLHRGVGRNLSMGGGGGVVLNVNFKKCFFAMISALTFYIGNV